MNNPFPPEFMAEVVKEINDRTMRDSIMSKFMPGEIKMPNPETKIDFNTLEVSDYAGKTREELEKAEWEADMQEEWDAAGRAQAQLTCCDSLDGSDEELYDDGNETFDLTSDEFLSFTSMIGARGIDNTPFWNTPEFEESDFQIIDNQIEFKPDVDQNNSQGDFFYSYLKPLVDHALSKWPNGDGITNEAVNDDYERAMNLLK